MASRLAALPCALCVLVLPSSSANPSVRSEGFVSASAQQDQMMTTLAPAAPPTPAPTGFALAFFVSQCLFQSHTTFFCVRSQTDTATAARRCTKPCHDLGREVHTSMSRWSLVLLRHNRCFQVLRPAVPRKASHFLQLTYWSRISLQVARGATISLSGLHSP